MTNNKNVVEEALFQIRNLEETLQENAKGILQSTMSEEIRQLVKESLKEQDEIETPPVDDDMPMGDEEDFSDDDEEDFSDDDEEDFSDDDEEDFSDDDEEDFSDDDEETIDMTKASDEEVLRVFKAMGDEDGIIVKKEGENIHLTDGDNEYMIQLGESQEDVTETMYEIEMEEEEDDDMEDMSKMDEEWSWGGAAMGAVKGGLGLSEEDDIEDKVVYEIQMDEEDDMSIHGMEVYEEDLEEGMYSEFDEESDPYADTEDPYADELGEDLYADELGEDLYESKKSMKSKGLESRRGPKFNYDKKPNMSGGFNTKRKEAFGKGTKAMGTGKAKFEYKEGVNMEKGSMKKVETKEASRTYGNGSKNGSRGLRKARLNNRNMELNPFKLSESSINEVNLLREKNEEYKQALDVFRTKLNEVAVFNSNLAYATRLFTEHSTTKQEKINILKRFDNVESLKESKNLYRSIKTELNSGSNVENKINESIERTVKTVSTGSAVNLIESKTYENPQFMRMKDLMTKLK